jgi:hypothetical protein
MRLRLYSLVRRHRPLLLGGHAFRDHDFEAYEVVALLALVRRQLLHAVVSYFRFFIVASARLYFKFDVLVQSLYSHFAAEHSLRKRDEAVTVDISAISFKSCVRLNLQIDN